MSKRSSSDSRARIVAARIVCPWCAPHYRARIEGRSGDHTRCDDLHCGCHCQDPLKVN